eukprot:3834213-Pleurochrysis_carterae.AAC.1
MARAGDERDSARRRVERAGAPRPTVVRGKDGARRRATRGGLQRRNWSLQTQTLRCSRRCCFYQSCFLLHVLAAGDIF